MKDTTNDLQFEDLKTMVTSMLKKNSLELSDIPAVITGSTMLSHSELKEHVSRAIRLLEKEELPKNICIGLRFANNLYLYIFHLALLKMGITQATINPFDTIKLQENSIKEMDIDLIIQDLSLDNILHEQTIQVIDDFNIQNNIYKKIQKYNNIPENISSIILGSGTTGKKKVLHLKSKMLASRYRDSIDVFHGDKKERFFCYTSIYYPSARFNYNLALLKGMTVVLWNNNYKDLISFCIDNKIDHIHLTGDQASNILLKNIRATNDSNNLEIKLPELKSCVLSNSLISESLRTTILSTITKNLYVLYGTNEFGIISEATPLDIKMHPGTVGKPLSNITLKIVDDNGKECKVEEIGNILVKSDSMIDEYLNSVEDTNKSFGKNGFYPGDLGRLTQDGNLIIEGRKDDMMIFSGVNIYPRELESLLESHPKVIEAAVFPLTINNQSGIPFAVVVTSEEISENELIQYCYNEVGWRRPQKIFFTKSLPKNSGGKVLKRVLIQEVTKIVSN